MKFELQYAATQTSTHTGVISAFIHTVIGATLSARKMQGGMSPVIAAWISNIVLIAISSFLYKKHPIQRRRLILIYLSLTYIKFIAA